MGIPSPQQLGLHEKFERWRPAQEECIRVMGAETRRVSAPCAPTGFGKTAAYVATALISKEPTCIVTANKGLADQLITDHSCVGLVDIRGRANYACEMRDDYTCEDGHAARCPYKGSINCPSSQAEMRAATSSLVVTNYAKWIAARRYGQGMSHFTQVIFDEFHQAPQMLADAMQVTLHHKEIEKTLGLDFPGHPEADDFRNWKPWASETRAIAEQEMLLARQRIADSSDPKPTLIRHYHHMKNLARRLATIATASPTNWVVDEVEAGYQFDPINPARYAESVLLLRVPKIIAVSATMRPKTLYMTGIAKDTFTFNEYKSDFDPARCPFYYIPTMRVDNRVHDLGMLWIRHDQIAAKRRDRKSLLHTISYARRDEVMARSKYGEFMLTNKQGEPITYTIDEFRCAGPGTILATPSVGTGYDFPMKDAEWQFVSKIPFLDGRSKVTQARQDQDPEYGPYHAMQTLVQIVGRLMRSTIDRGESFLGDDHWRWFYSRYYYLAPSSFHKFYKEVSAIPPAPPAL